MERHLSLSEVCQTHIQKYSSKHLDQFISLYKSIWEKDPYREVFTDTEIKETLLKQDAIFLLITGDELHGFIAGYDYAKRESTVKIAGVPFYFSELAIAENVRGQGFADFLIKELEKSALIQGFTSMVLRTSNHETNPAFKCYKRNGYMKITDQFGRPIQDEVLQRRTNGRVESDIREYYSKQLIQ